MSKGFVLIPHKRTRLGAVYEGIATTVPSPRWGQGRSPAPIVSCLDRIKSRLLSQTERRDAESNTLIGIVHRYTMLNPFNIFEKDTRMTCLQLLVWRINIYGYRAGPFAKDL
jgi:hypothetical protein